ncbi:MAG: 50S ribosomal protein L3 N(5)-glutamine methyltransferase [Cellvibrionaceae bacterium]|nr:50S ribosomal protein L3 N(5)-glutamine methyltransferase [Cellvibrionaceae bacterium]
MKTSAISIQSCIDQGERLFRDAKLFFGHGTDNAADEALWLIMDYLDIPWDSAAEILQQTLSAADYQAIQTLFQRRIDERVPAAYLTGTAWFAGYQFVVNPQVLVPRSPLAECVRAGFQPWLAPMRAPRILDLCTGSGCIGLATALQLPSAQVTLSDISAAALEVAQQNIQRHQLADRVDAVLSDGFQALACQPFDLIVCNPPYVDAQDFSAMPEEYRAEPAIALCSGEDGLDFTRTLLAEAAAYLKPGACLIVEVGNSAVALEEAFSDVPFMWLEFSQGGQGVFVLTREQLDMVSGRI